MDPTTDTPTDEHARPLPICELDRFLPVRSSRIIRQLVEDADDFGIPADDLQSVADAVNIVIVQEASAFEDRLANDYEPFNPDRETIVRDLTDDESETLRTHVVRTLDYLLEKCNYRCLRGIDIDELLTTATRRGLKVRINEERVKHLSVWVRGTDVKDGRRRTWRHPIKGVEETVRVYPRLAVVARLVDDPNVIIKLFREIPSADVEALLPHAEAKMSLIDRIKLIGSGAASISTVTKVWKLLFGISFASQIIFGFWIFWAIVCACAFLFIRTLLGYRAARRLRSSMRTQHLYYQNLASNAAVLQLLTSKIREEETKEAVLAYAMCTKHAGQFNTTGDLRARVEEYIKDTFDVTFDFDVEDAIETLERLRLFADRQRFAVHPPARAREELERHRVERRTIGYHHDTLHERAAASVNSKTDP